MLLNFQRKLTTQIVDRTENCFDVSNDPISSSTSDDEKITLQPQIKDETFYDSQGLLTVTKTVWYTAAKIAKFQEKYSRLTYLLETGYVWRVPLAEGD